MANTHPSVPWTASQKVFCFDSIESRNFVYVFILFLAGKTNVKSATKRPNRELGREDRRRQANQIRKNKRQEAIALKRAIGGATTAPFLTCVIPLNGNVDPNSAFAIIESCDEEATVQKVSERVRYMK